MHYPQKSILTHHSWFSRSGIQLASFPGYSHLQYLIACSMQIRRGKAWEIWSRVVPSGRQVQRVDTWGVVLNGNNSHFVSKCPQHWERKIVLFYAVLLLFWPPAVGLIVSRFIEHRCPCVYVLPSVYLTWPNLPGLPPPYLHTASNQILEVGTAWEQG